MKKEVNFKKRIIKLLDEATDFSGPPNEKHKIALSLREGDYVIKMTKNHPWFMGKGGRNYLDVSCYFDGWLTSGARKTAQWFHKHELKDVIKHFNGGKGYQIVKLSKNKK